MYVYEIGYGSHENSAWVMFYHEKKLSQKQLSKLVEDCLLAVLVKVVKPKSAFEHERDPSFETLMDRPEFLIELQKRGFQKIRPDQHWGVFGWACAIDTNDWKHDTDRKQKALIRRLRKRLLQERPDYKKELGLEKRKFIKLVRKRG